MASRINFLRTQLTSFARTCALCLGLILGTVAHGQVVTETVTVKRGDSFAQIATRLGADAKKWRQLYDSQRSRLADPNQIQVGQQLELVSEASGVRYLRLVGGQAAAAAPQAVAAPTAPVAAASAEELVIGVLPNIGAALLQSQYEHVKRYLERQNSFKVRIIVPSNFKAFFDAMVAGEYDVAVSAPNLARVAQLDRGLVPIGMYEPRIGALFVAPAERAVAGPRDAVGLAIGFSNPQSLVALYGQQWLRSANMEPGRDYEIKAARTDLGIGRMLLTGNVAAAIMSNGEFRALPADESSRLKIVEVFARFPNFMLMANPKMPAARVDRLRTQFKAMFADQSDGAAFVRATGLNGFNDIDETALRDLDAFNPPTRRAMGLPAR